MESRHATTLALLLGAFALVFALTGVFILQFASITTGERLFSLSKIETFQYPPPPSFISKIEGSEAVIAEIDTEGKTVHAIYTSSLLDSNVDFSLFAVPQEHYKNIIYVQAVTDAELALLKIYPLNVATGKLEVSILNTESESTTLSLNEERVAIINKQTLALYDLSTGKRLTSWELLVDEQWRGPDGIFRGGWKDASCFEHLVWYGDKSELLTFCAP